MAWLVMDRGYDLRGPITEVDQMEWVAHLMLKNGCGSASW